MIDVISIGYVSVDSLIALGITCVCRPRPIYNNNGVFVRAKTKQTYDLKLTNLGLAGYRLFTGVCQTVARLLV